MSGQPGVLGSNNATAGQNNYPAWNMYHDGRMDPHQNPQWWNYPHHQNPVSHPHYRPSSPMMQSHYYPPHMQYHAPPAGDYGAHYAPSNWGQSNMGPPAVSQQRRGQSPLPPPPPPPPPQMPSPSDPFAGMPWQRYPLPKAAEYTSEPKRRKIEENEAKSNRVTYPQHSGNPPPPEPPARSSSSASPNSRHINPSSIVSPAPVQRPVTARITQPKSDQQSPSAPTLSPISLTESPKGTDKRSSLPRAAKSSSSASVTSQSASSQTTQVTPALKMKMLGIRDDDGLSLRSIDESFERTQAEKLMASNISQAATHIGRALVKNPKQLDLVEKLLTAMKSQKSDILVTHPTQPFHRTALQAFIYARLSRYAEAIVLLLLTFSECCRASVFSWVFEEWDLSPTAFESAIKKVPMDALKLPMQVLMKRHQSILSSDTSLTTALKLFSKFMEKTYAVKRSEFDSNSIYLLSTTLRKAGEFDIGLRLLQELHAQKASWKTCIGMGYILREMNQPEKAIEWFENAAGFDPPNQSFLLDAADTSLRIGQISRAQSHYQTILRHIPDNAWAQASLAYIEFLVQGSEDHFGTLLQMATKGNRRAKTLLKEALEIFKLYRVHLPDPCDCFVSAMQELRNYEYRPPSGASDRTPDSPPSLEINVDDSVSSPVTTSEAQDNRSQATTGFVSSSDISEQIRSSLAHCSDHERDTNIDVVKSQEVIREALSRSRERQPLKSDEVRVAVSALEAPSYTIVWKFLNKIYNMNFKYEVELISGLSASPVDPRYPIEQVSFLTWQYNGIKPKPAIPMPKLLDVMRLLQPISTIARSEFDVSRWMRQSERIASEVLLPPIHHVDESLVMMLLGLMLHAEEFLPLPETWGIPTGARYVLLADSREKHAPVWTWIYSIYVVVTMIIACALPSNLLLNSLDEWRKSLQYRTLHSLLMGPMDWVVDAAVIVFARLALDQTLPSFVEPEVVRLFLLRAQHTPSTGYVCYRKVLLCHLIMLPSVRPEQRLIWINSLKKQM